jgi:hypothetical protein
LLELTGGISVTALVGQAEAIQVEWRLKAAHGDDFAATIEQGARDGIAEVSGATDD